MYYIGGLFLLMYCVLYVPAQDKACRSTTIPSKVYSFIRWTANVGLYHLQFLSLDLNFHESHIHKDY